MPLIFSGKIIKSLIILQLERLTEIANEYDLEQLVKEATRIHGNTRNIFDMVFTSNNTIVNNVNITPGISDHDIVSFTVNLTPKKKLFSQA